MSLDMREAPRNLHRADALRAFKKHADETNDIFHIAAQVIAMTILRADRLLTNGCAGGTAISFYEGNFDNLNNL